MKKPKGAITIRTFKQLIDRDLIAHSGGETELCCVATGRRTRAGSTTPQTSILVQGPLTRSTWQKIKDSMLAFELVPLGHPDHGAEKIAGLKSDARRALSGFKVTARPVDQSVLAEFRKRIEE